MLNSVTILGATGSIGVSTLDVIARHPDRYQVFALSANSSVEKLAEQVAAFRPRFAVIGTELLASRLRQLLQDRSIDGTEVVCGEQGLLMVAAHAEVDTVMAAIVGAAGLLPTMAAVEAGKKVLLANKESLVMAGHLFMQAVRDSGACLLPIDSEHNAIFQCMARGFSEGLQQQGVRKILLTGSGGPFRATPLEQLATITPDQACAHPNWSMGRKISVDSATMMNKGLELIEACWLFDCTPEQVQIVVHPQSVIHSMVEYVDGSVLAQLGNPDMRTPIAHGLAWPERIESGVASLDVIATARLDFEKPDFLRFPCLRLAVEAVRRGGTAMAVLNAANEIAVAAFLDGEVGFIDIPVIIEHVMGEIEIVEPHSLAVVQQADRLARAAAVKFIADALAA